MASAFRYSSSFAGGQKREHDTPPERVAESGGTRGRCREGCEVARRVGQRNTVNLRRCGHRDRGGPLGSAWAVEDLAGRPPPFRRWRRNRPQDDVNRGTRASGPDHKGLAQKIYAARDRRGHVSVKHRPSASSGRAWTLSRTRSLSSGLRGGRREARYVANSSAG